jgi:regulatory protein
MLLTQRIKEIKTQVRHPDRRTIIFDDGTFIGISEEVLLSNPVHPGDELTPNKLKQLTNSEQKQKLRNSALNLLSFRMRSLSELKQRLLKKGYDVQDIEPLLEEFDAKNILNDSEFALAFSRDKIRSKGIGPSILRVELSNHHLPQNLVEDTVNRMYTEFPIDTLLGNHLKKKKIFRNSQLQEREKSRIVNFLKRKGFSWDDISRVFVDKQIT